jgi:hypothetical protein
MGKSRMARIGRIRGLSPALTCISTLLQHDSLIGQDESDLTSLRALNTFSASIILCQITLQEFLDLSPGERIKLFGSLVGEEVMVSILSSSTFCILSKGPFVEAMCNSEIESRFQELEAPVDRKELLE